MRRDAASCRELLVGRRARLELGDFGRTCMAVCVIKNRNNTLKHGFLACFLGVNPCRRGSTRYTPFET